jgi:hypothetical protein
MVGEAGGKSRLLLARVQHIPHTLLGGGLYPDWVLAPYRGMFRAVHHCTTSSAHCTAHSPTDLDELNFNVSCPSMLSTNSQSCVVVCCPAVS